MSDDWQSRFSKKLQAKQQQRRELRRDFQAYRTHVDDLFARIEQKVKGVGAISVDRPMMVRTNEFRDNVDGPVDNIKSLLLRCDGKPLELIPEGINFEFGKGRVRVRHKSKLLHDYIYLHLVLDPASEATYPENLRWMMNVGGGNPPPPESLSVFDDDQIEQLMESAFLSADLEGDAR